MTKQRDSSKRAELNTRPNTKHKIQDSLPGLNWFDNSPRRDVAEKARLAASYFRVMYGRVADSCEVHPTEAPEQVLDCGIAVKHNPFVLPSHYWIKGERLAEECRCNGLGDACPACRGRSNPDDELPFYQGV